MDKLNTQEFYELMQAYRHAPATPQEHVIEAFDAVKAFVRTQRPPLTDKQLIEAGQQTYWKANRFIAVRDEREQWDDEDYASYDEYVQGRLGTIRNAAHLCDNGEFDAAVEAMDRKGYYGEACLPHLIETVRAARRLPAG